MRSCLARDLPASCDAVRYVLETSPEYPRWSTMTRAAGDELHWEVPLLNGGVKSLPGAVSLHGDATHVHLHGRIARLDMRVDAKPAGVHHTDLTIAVAARAFTRVDIGRMLQTFSTDLATRVRWLGRAPDTRFVPSLSDPLVLPADRMASLEQLRTVTRELEGGILAVDAGSHCCLLDLERRRFVRVEAGEDIARLVAFARWHPFDHVSYDGTDVVIVPSAGAARVRIRPHAPAGPALSLVTD
jgi:hypothetical protein